MCYLRPRGRGAQQLGVLSRNLLSAVGGTFEKPAVTYFQTDTTPQLVRESVLRWTFGPTGRFECRKR
jgi:hypothetical protein